MKKQISECTILLVEDELPLVRAIQKKLENHGFEVVTARKAEQALGLLEDVEGIDLIWLDHYLLGKETGLEFVQKVKASEKWKDIPIYLVTNTATQGKIHTYMKLGVDKYYIKAGVRLDEVISEIENQVCNPDIPKD